MNAMLNRTRSTLALGIGVVSVAAGSLVSVPTAAACPINADGTCLTTRYNAQIPTPTAKPQHAKHHKSIHQPR